MRGVLLPASGFDFILRRSFLYFSERLSARVRFTRFIKDTPESHLMKVSAAPLKREDS